MSITDPIQPLPPNLFFSSTLIFQLWQSNFPVTQAKNNNKRASSFNSISLTIPIQPLSRSHWFYLCFRPWPSPPLPSHWHLLGSGSHPLWLEYYTFFPLVFSPLPFFALLPTLSFIFPCPFKISKRGTSVCFIFVSSYWAQPITKHMVSHCWTDHLLSCHSVIPEIQWTPVAYQIKAGEWVGLSLIS